MPSQSPPWLALPWTRRAFRAVALTLLLLAVVSGALRAELDISGQKEFRYRGYRHSGSFNQFLQENPLFLQGDGFEQSLRLDVDGTLFENVKLELSFDDSLERKEDQKLLVSIDGKRWDATAGRMSLALDDTAFLLYNKNALAATVTGLVGRHHLVTLTAARPEGRQRRQTFPGNGSQQEFVLSDSEGHRNIRIVQGSDQVYLDGRRLERGTDYEVDYEEGSVVIRHHLLPIEPTSLLTVEFEASGVDNSALGTIVAFRDRYFLDGLDDPSARQADDQFVAVSVVTSSEKQAPPVTGPSLDARLTVAGLDAHLDVPGDLVFAGQFAASRMEADTLGGGPVAPEQGTALDLDLARKEGRLTFDLSHRSVGPGFQAVGRREFIRLNERSDLIGDARLTRLDGDYDFDRRLAANLRLDLSRSNLEDDPALPTIDFEALLAGVTYNPAKDASFALRRRSERQDRSGGTVAAGNQDRDVSTATLSGPVFGLTAQAALESENNDSTLAGGAVTDFVTRRFHLGSGGGPRLGWSAGVENQKRPGLGESTSAQLLLDFTPMSQLKGSFSFLRRLEDGQLTPTTTAAAGTTDTGELKLRYEPSRELTFDVKGSAEQRGRVTRVRDPRLPVVYHPDEREPLTLVADNPVLRLVGSNTVEWRPSRRFDHRLQLRLNRETDTTLNQRISENTGLNYRLKFAPTGRLRFLTEYQRDSSMNSLAPVDRDQEVRGLQILEAFPHGLSVTLTRRETLADDRVLAAEENELLHGLGLEKILSRLLTAEAALEKKARTGRFRDDALTARATVRFSPAKLPLHSEVTVEHSTIDGVTTAGSPLDSYKDRVGVKADYRFGADTLVEVSTELVDAGPTVAGDTGYKAITGEARVSITF